MYRFIALKREENFTCFTAPSVVPQDLMCAALDSKSIKLSWSIMAAKSEIIEGFYIGYKPVQSLQSLTYKTMQTSNEGLVSARNGHMTAKYEFVIDSLTRQTKYV